MKIIFSRTKILGVGNKNDKKHKDCNKIGT